MTVLVHKSPKRYESLGKVGSTLVERDKADKLDKILGRHIKALEQLLREKKLMPDYVGKGSLLTYWNVGRALRSVTSHSELFNDAELPLLWRAAKMHIPKELLYKDRGPYREHLWYCYRLAGYPKRVAQKMNWGEWVTIFDSPGINQEPRFDEWFCEKLRTEKGRLNRGELRVFAPCVNRMLGDIDIQELEVDELFNCYDAAWQLMKHSQSEKDNKPISRKELQRGIESLLGRLDQVMDGKLPPGDYAKEVIRSVRGA